MSIYPDFVKLSKQFTYADKNKYNYVLIYGKEEAEEKVIKIKNLIPKIGLIRLKIAI
mgnify:CR=1 FL=1